MSRQRFSHQYLAHLRSPYWRDLRQEVFAREQYCCRQCGKHTTALELDHLHYRTLGHEGYADVQPLCHVCHDKKTSADRHARRWPKRRQRRVWPVVILIGLLLLLVLMVPRWQ